MTLTPSVTFLANASPAKPLDSANYFLQVHRSHDVEGTGQHLDKGKKADIVIV